MPCAARPRDRENGPCSARPCVQPDKKAHVQQVNTFTIADWCGGAPAAACIMLWCNMNFDFQGIPRIFSRLSKNHMIYCAHQFLHQFLRNLHAYSLPVHLEITNHRSAHQLLGFSRSHTTHKTSQIETLSEIFPKEKKRSRS